MSNNTIFQALQERIAHLQERNADLQERNYHLELRNNQLEQRDVERKIHELETSMEAEHEGGQPAKKARVVQMEAPPLAAQAPEQPGGDGGVPSWLRPSTEPQSLGDLGARDMNASKQQRKPRTQRKPRKQGKCTKCNMVTEPPHNSRTCKWAASTSSAAVFGIGFDHATIPLITTSPTHV